jgi:hypothetical protein
MARAAANHQHVRLGARGRLGSEARERERAVAAAREHHAAAHGHAAHVGVVVVERAQRVLLVLPRRCEGPQGACSVRGLGGLESRLGAMDPTWTSP